MTVASLTDQLGNATPRPRQVGRDVDGYARRTGLVLAVHHPVRGHQGGHDRQRGRAARRLDVVASRPAGRVDGVPHGLRRHEDVGQDLERGALVDGVDGEAGRECAALVDGVVDARQEVEHQLRRERYPRREDVQVVLITFSTALSRPCLKV